MSEDDKLLPGRVAVVEVGDRKVYLVGTAHVSQQSVDDVRATIEAVKPDTICVELCQGRYESMVQRDAWEKMNIFKVIREKKAAFLLAQLIMTSFYRRLGDKLGVQPGAEMFAAIELAKEKGAELVLADRRIDITLKRVWGYLNFFNKMKMFFQLLCGLFEKEDINQQMVEELKNQDQLESAMAAFTEAFPEVKKRLLDERDVFLAQKIRHAGGGTIVAAVGAGHVEGIKEHIQKDIPLAPLMEIPPKSAVGAVVKWGIPAAIVLLLVMGFFKGGLEHSARDLFIWIMVNGILSAVGAAVAFGHPLTVLSAFVGAPITSLNPMIAAGWVAGLVQAFVKKPTVADFKDIPNAVMTVKGFWGNPVIRILLVVAFANIGSSLGTFISAGWIGARALGK